MPRISKKLVFGKGMKGDNAITVNGETTKAYSTWAHMLERCYCPKYLSKQPTYIGCSVCDEWLFFPNFQKWFDNNYVEGWQLDKDLLVLGNKTYSSETCVFVPSPINTLFNDQGRTRGKYPIGVTFHKRRGKFVTHLSIDGKLKHLGYFSTADEASQAYQLAKKENVIRMVTEWKEKIPTKLYDVLLTKAENKL